MTLSLTAFEYFRLFGDIDIGGIGGLCIARPPLLNVCRYQATREFDGAVFDFVSASTFGLTTISLAISIVI
jgi:hypothetical protein